MMMSSKQSVDTWLFPRGALLDDGTAEHVTDLTVYVNEITNFG
jgi:hypothetical protein